MIKITQLPPDSWKSYKDIRLEALQDTPLAFGSLYEEDLKKYVVCSSR